MARVLRVVRWFAALVALALWLTACGGSSSTRGGTPAGPSAARATTVPSSTAPGTTLATHPCDGRPPPPAYEHVVVVMMENRTWSQVGGPGFPSMPFLRGLAQSCAYFEQWDDTNARQSSLTQYVGLTSGVDNPHTVNDCNPSPSCSSTDDNLFRAVRTSGGAARSYVEGATAPCSATGNAPRHVPALYYRGSYSDATGSHTDGEFCASEVRPLDELDPENLPTLAFVVPDLCHDGHDCGDDVTDAYLDGQLTALVNGRTYRDGRTAIFVLWDEDRPAPNLVVAPSAQPGPRPGAGSHAAALRTILDLLGLPALPAVATVPDLRAPVPL